MSIEITRTTFQSIEKAMQDAGFAVERVKQEISFALQIINRSKQLQKCTIDSIRQAVLNIANVGLTLNPAAKEAYLVPRWNNNNKTYEASLDPSYIGFVKLLTDAGSITSILCQLVYENDKFSIDLANNTNPVTHLPKFPKTERGKLIGVYALGTLHDGTRQSEYMDIEEVYAIRDRSESYKAYLQKTIPTCTWVTDEGEMARKTVIKRICKYLPRTDRMEKLDRAIQIDNQDYTASAGQMSYIESLLLTSSLDDRQRSAIEYECSGNMSSHRASDLINMLKQNQLDKISAGLNYNSGDISDHLKKL